MRCVLVAFTISCLCPHVGFAQAPPAFEVSSIKPNRSATTSWTMGCATATAVGNIAPGRCVGTNVSLLTLIAQAYNIPTATAGQRVSGLPGWARTQRFDLEAKAANATASDAELRLMLRQLLAERFTLKVSEQVKEADGYALIVAKGGPKLKKLGEQTRQAQAVPLAFRVRNTEALANTLAARLGRPVVNMTSITGDYDFTVTAAAVSDDNGASLFTFLEEEFGLKLVSQKVPVPVLIVDSVAPLTEQ
jgi:uncharacterized protein (TIGR03435 family)